eukprot:298395-Alexandrium_andersonii.AAC.1
MWQLLHGSESETGTSIHARVVEHAGKWMGGIWNQRVAASDWPCLLNPTTLNCGGSGLPVWMME